MIKFTAEAVTIDAAGPDGQPRRTISGIAVPYGVEATVSDGTVVRVLEGALPVDGKPPRLFMNHDSSSAIGLVVSRESTPDGMLFTAKISDTVQGNEAMTLMKDGVLDSVSIGISPTSFSYDEAGVMEIKAATWTELSVVAIPAFQGAQITEIAASIHHEDETTDNNEIQEPTEETTMSEVTEVVAAVEASIPTPLFASAKREPRLPSAAEFLAAQHAGGESAVQANRVWNEYRAYHKSPIEAAAGDEVLSNVGGIVPVPLLGPVFADINYIAPVLTALGTRAMPGGGAGSTFTRPTWTTHPSVAEQTTELTAVSATTAVIAANTVTKKTFAGSANMSYQVIDFTDPAALEVVIRDLSGQYLDAIDNFAADATLAAATSAGVWDLSVADLLKSIYDAAVVTSAATNFLPTHIMVDPATWGLMMQLADSTGRPIFGYTAGGLNGFNSLGSGAATTWGGSNPLGLEIVVDKNFAAKTMVILNKNAMEIYRQDRGLLSVESPTTLGRSMSIFGYAASFKANANMIQKITQA